jgi:hypothetical protein
VTAHTRHNIIVIVSITNSCFTLSIQLTLVVFGESRLPVEFTSFSETVSGRSSVIPNYRPKVRINFVVLL